MSMNSPSRTDQLHRAISADGTEIVGRVHGQGPPLVLVHGAMADGDLEWEALLPHLTGRFTCYVMSTRGRGLSGDAADHSPDRLAEDVAAFADSVAEPVGLVGVSGGGMNALGGAARSAAVAAVAVYEPVVFEVIDEETAAGFQETQQQMEIAVASGRVAEAARIFLEPVLNDEEMAAVSVKPGYFEAAGRNVPVDLQEFRHIGASELDPTRPGPTDPSTLARIAAPVLVLYGSETALGTWAVDGARHVTDHVPDARLRELPGAGHLAPSAQPEAVAGEIAAFLEVALQPA